MIYSRSLSILLFAYILSILACTGENKPSSSFKMEMDLVRFDQLMMEMDSNNIQSSFADLQQKYPEFTDIFFTHVMPFSYDENMDSFHYYLHEFITDDRIRAVYQMIDDRFGDFEKEKKELENSFGRAKSIFPDLKEPRIYTYLSEFSLQRFLFEDHDRDGLALGLDLFLEGEFDYFRLEQGQNTFAKYLTRSYDEKHLVRKTMEAWLEDKMGQEKGNRLIDQMIHNGKKLYYLDQIIQEEDSILLEYTHDELTWLENNEREMWAHFFENDWFYTTDQYVIKRLVLPAPNSTAIGMPSNSPGQTANYLGYKIVSSYMKRYPESTFEELMQVEAQQLLELSKFKPGLN